MLEDVRKSFLLLLPPLRWRWAGLIPFVVAAAAMEALGAAVIFGLIKIVSDPVGVSQMRVAGTLSEFLPARNDRGIVFFFTALVALFYIVKNLLLTLVEHLQGRVISDSKVELSRRLLRGYLTLPYACHLRRNSAELIRNTVDSVDTAVGAVMQGALATATEAMVVTSIVAILMVTAPLVTLIAVGVLFSLLGILVWLTRRTVTRWGAREQELKKARLQSLQESLGALKEVRLRGREQFFYDSFSGLQKALMRVRHLYDLLSAIPRLLVETMFVCGLLLVILLITTGGVARQDILPLLGLYAYAGFRIIPSLNRILMHLHHIRHASAAVGGLYQDFLLFKGFPADGFVPSEKEAVAFTEHIVLEQVSYTYEGSSAAVLHNVSLEIRRGESVGIVGPTGAGKSTLINLILGLLQPSQGRILVDGWDILRNLRSWQRRIGYVPQEVYLIDDSIRRNIGFGIPDKDIDDPKVLAALRMAQLDEWVTSLPQGLDTRLGDRGVRLSGGERQRVGIARALYDDPELLVLDEPTSALDSQTERELTQAVEALRGQKTLIIIAHRLSTVRNCDRLVFLRNGRIEGCGTLGQLMEQSAEFCRIVYHPGRSEAAV